MSALERRFLATGTPRDLTLFAGSMAWRRLRSGPQPFGAPEGPPAARGGRSLGPAGCRRSATSRWSNLDPGKSPARRASSASCFATSRGVSRAPFPKSACTPSSGVRHGGGRIVRTTKDIVALVEVDGEEWLFYKVGRVNVAFIRGTTADTFGNITGMERQRLTLTNLLKRRWRPANSNGIVIALGGTALPSEARWHCCASDEGPRHHLVGPCVSGRHDRMSDTSRRSPSSTTGLHASEFRRTPASPASTALNERKIIARRAAFDLPPNGIITRHRDAGRPRGCHRQKSIFSLFELR